MSQTYWAEAESLRPGIIKYLMVQKHAGQADAEDAFQSGLLRYMGASRAEYLNIKNLYQACKWALVDIIRTNSSGERFANRAFGHMKNGVIPDYAAPFMAYEENTKKDKAGRQSLSMSTRVSYAAPCEWTSVETIEALDIFGRLPLRYRQAMVMTWLGIESPEAAELLNIPEGTFRVRLARGRKMAREMAGFGTCKTILGADAHNQPLGAIKDTKQRSTGLSDINTKLSEGDGGER